MGPFGRDRALLVVDVQNDFLAGGSLSVPGGDEIIPVLNRYLALATLCGTPVFAVRDWHPQNHRSFRAHGGPWPPHCVAGSSGAEFSKALRLPETARIISKGVGPDDQSYSAFQAPELEPALRSLGIRGFFIGGLTTEYCVLETTKAGLGRGFEVGVLIDAIRAVDLRPDDGERAEEEMRRLGARRVRLDELEAATLEHANASGRPAH